MKLIQPTTHISLLIPYEALFIQLHQQKGLLITEKTPGEPNLLFQLYLVLPAFQVQVLIWTGDSGSNPERAHGDKFLVCQ
jgi:hypothetical protein